MRDQLLGYLVRALDDGEREQLERRLEQDSTLRIELERLQGCLGPLSCDCEPLEAPNGLAGRTCEFVALRARVSGRLNDGALVERSAAVESRGGWRSWRLVDTIVAGGVIAVAAILFFPALMQTRSHADLEACQHNLQRLHAALVSYASTHKDMFPVVPAAGNEAAAGIYAVRLFESGFVDDASLFLCPSSPMAAEAAGWSVPTSAEISAAGGGKLDTLQRTMGGSYGYTLGYVGGGKYHGTKNLGRQFFALMADALDPDSGRERSCNHGGRGQNVMFEGGRVAYLTSCSIEGHCDDFFHNDRGEIAAGLHRNDAVIAHSAVGPRPAVEAVAAE